MSTGEVLCRSRCRACLCAVPSGQWQVAVRPGSSASRTGDGPRSDNAMLINPLPNLVRTAGRGPGGSFCEYSWGYKCFSGGTRSEKDSHFSRFPQLDPTRSPLSMLMAPLWLTQPSAHRSLSSPSHLIFACAQRPGASGVRTHLLTGFAGRTDSLAPVLALDRAAAPGSSPTRCELGSSLFGPLQVLSSTAFDLPIILAISDTFSAALEVLGPPWSLPSTHDRACRPDASAP